MPMSEQRKYIRVNIPMDIACVLDESNKIIEVIGKDISLGGIRVMVKDPLSVGALLTMTIKVGFCADPIIIGGKVIWQNYNVRSSEYDTGIGFVKVDQENKIRISEVMIAAVDAILQQLNQMMSEERLK